MIKFVNAKINLGLNITARREDGYHLLESVFYPIGRHNGTPLNPQPFCDILEGTLLPPEAIANEYHLSGKIPDCPLEKNLVVKAAERMSAETGRRFRVECFKHIPDGAGLGGGSADATFTLRMLNEICGSPVDRSSLLEIAASLGADCPFFVDNRPCFVEGIGEIMSPVEARLEGWWALVIKPEAYVSTREAFAGITPRKTEVTPLEIYRRPVEEWRDMMTNDFEPVIFHRHPELAAIKDRLYAEGAVYAQMSGSGSALYGLFRTAEEAKKGGKAFAGLPAYVCML